MAMVEASVVRTDGEISLRLPRPSDMSQLARWGSDAEFARYHWASEPWSNPPALAARFIEHFAAMPANQGGLFMVDLAHSGATIGYVNFRDVRPRVRSCEMGAAIADRMHWEQGYGTRAARLLLEHLFGSLGMHKVTLRVVAFNTPAIRGYERCGFRREGRLRDAYRLDDRWWDSLLMAILEDDWATQSAANSQSPAGESAKLR